MTDGGGDEGDRGPHKARRVALVIGFWLMGLGLVVLITFAVAKLPRRFF